MASGIYHGINPGMGWPLAVSSALMEQKSTSLYKAMAALALGHLIAMAAILLPFSLLFWLVEWQTLLQRGAALLVIGLGLYLLINRRHPRFLARVPPSKLTLWSFLVAMAHGAGLMLVPIYLGLCAAPTDAGHAAVETLFTGTLATALLVAALHTSAMVLSGGAVALGVYHWLGLRFLQKSWFNLDIVWALSLILVGVVALFASH